MERSPVGMTDAGGRDEARAWWVSVLVTALVVAVGAVVAVRTVDVDKLFASFGDAKLRVLVVAVVVYAGSWPLRGWRYDEILGAMGRRCGLGFLTGVVFLSQTANLVVPARAGDGARAYLLKRRRGVPYATGGASLAVERLFDLLALAVFGALAAAWLVATGGELAPGETATFLAGAGFVTAAAVVAAAVLVVLARSDREFGDLLRERVEHPRLQSLVDGVVRFGGELRVVATDPWALARIATGSLAVWALDVLTAVLVLGALAGGVLGVADLVVVGTLAVPVGNLAKVLPLSQGGIGLYEAAFTALVVAASPVAPAVALAAAVLDHGLKNALTLVGGAAAAVGLNSSLTVASDA